MVITTIDIKPSIGFGVRGGVRVLCYTLDIDLHHQEGCLVSPAAPSKHRQ